MGYSILYKISKDSKKMIEDVLNSNGNFSLKWGSEVFPEISQYLQKLMNLTYENSKKLDIKLNIENYSIKSCGSLPCIYEKALLEKEKILNLMKSHDKWKQLHAEFCNIFDMGKDGLITFQNKDDPNKNIKGSNIDKVRQSKYPYFTLYN